MRLLTVSCDICREKGRRWACCILFYMAKDREAAGNFSLDRVSRTGHITGLQRYITPKAWKKDDMGG